jgi:hypothetical protein
LAAETKDSLRRLKLTAKSARLAREMLAWDEPAAPAAGHGAAARALAGRLERAEKWARCGSGS